MKITDQIQGTAIKVVHSRITDVLLNVIYEIANLNGEYADTEIYGEVLAYDDIQDEIAKVQKLFSELPENLNKELEQRTGYSALLAATRAGLMEKHKAVFAYKAFCNKLDDISNHKQKIMLAKTGEMNDITLPNNIDMVDSIISHISHSYDIPYVVSTVLSKIPLRMTRVKYDELMERSLELLFTDMSSAFMENCKSTFAAQLKPQAAEGYGKFFPLIAQKLDELSKFDLENTDDEAFDEYRDMVDDLGETIESTEELLNVCFNIVNYLDILALYSMDESYATSDDLIIKDLLYSCVDMLKSDTPEMYVDAISEKSTELIEKLFAENRDYEDSLQDMIQGLDDKQKAALPDDARLVLQIYNSIVYMYMIDISDGITALDNTKMQPADMAQTDKAIEDVIKMINDCCEGLTSPEKKQLKQQFLSQVPIDISPNELRDYMQYALDGINDESLRLVTYGDIIEALDDMSLIGFDDGEEDDHHHHHDHDCDCGHDHHHGHDCDCGHDHHHGHHH